MEKNASILKEISGDGCGNSDSGFVLFCKKEISLSLSNFLSLSKGESW